MTAERPDIITRAFILYAIIFLFGIMIIIKALSIYITEREELVKAAKTQEVRAFILESSRGNILADQEDLLATSVPNFDIRMDVANDNIPDDLFYDKVDSLAIKLSELFPDHSQIYYKNLLINARKKKRRFQLIRRKVTYTELQEIRNFPLLRRGKTRGGLIIIQRDHRQRPFGELAARTIGFVNEKENIFVGLEGYFNDVLKGTDGIQLRRRINHGDWIPIHDGQEREPVNGKDIKTTINIDIQDVAQKALLNKLKYHEAAKGTVVVMEVKTGHIVAMVNLNYDPRDRQYHENYNFAVGQRYEPGSTFKLITIMAALENNKVKLSDSLIFNRSYITFHGKTMRDAHMYHQGHFTVREAFEHSSNMGLSTVAVNAFKDSTSQFVDFIYSTGINKKTGIEINGEPNPLIKHPVKNKNSWSRLTLPWMAIGYEVMLTPLQLLTYYNAVANNGKMIKPMLVTEIQQDGKTLKTFDTKVLNPQIASPSTIQQAQELLEGVVMRGTGRGLNNKNYKIAGKTGTAQISEGTSYNNGPRRYNASFVGYFPADDPQYSMIVVVNKPKKNGYYGATVAGPVFKEVANYIYANSISLKSNLIADTLKTKAPAVTGPLWYADIEKINEFLSIPTTVYGDKSNWVFPDYQDDDCSYSPYNVKHGIMPQTRGMMAKDAVFLLEDMGLKVSINGRGRVVAQSIKPGKHVKKGNHVTLRLGNW